MFPHPVVTTPLSSLAAPSSSNNSSSVLKYRVAQCAKARREDEYDSEDVENDSGDDYLEDGQKPPKSRKGLNGLSVGSSKSSRQRLTLPKAGPWHTDYVLSRGGVAQMKNRKDLNISAGYGKDNFWPRSAGLRELIQNMFDGALAALKAKPGCWACTAEDIEARPIFPPTGAWCGFPLNLHQVPFGQKLTFELHHKLTAASSPSKRSLKKEEPPLGWVSFQASSNGKCNLELYNGGQPLDFDCMTFGFSSKVGDSDFIGQHGDGMKMGINAIIRQKEDDHEHPPEVFYVTGKKQWDFLYVDDLLEAHQTQSKVPKVHGVLTQIIRFPLKSVRFEDFLFLRPAVDVLGTVISSIDRRGTVRHRVGVVLLDERLRHHIFVKGVFVQKRPDHTVGLHYGIDIWQNVEISRDRVGLQDDGECSNAAFRIWRSLFESSERARQLYIDLLIQHDSCIETRYIVEQLGKADAHLFFDQLRKDKGENVFFYHAEDAGETVRIIEQVLKKKPFLIPREFCRALLNCMVIITPEQARMKRFRCLSPSKYYNGDTPQLQYTAYLIKAFLDMDPDMMRFWDCFHFKSASANMGVEIVVDGGKVLLHDLTLSSVYIHRKPQFIMCFRHLRAADYLEETEPDRAHLDESLGDEQELAASEAEFFWEDDLSASVCDCSAIYVLHLMTQELTNVSTMQKTVLEMARQLALRSLPRNLTFVAMKPSHYAEDDAPLEMTLSWSTDDDLSGFKVFVYFDVHREPLLSEKKDEENRGTIGASPMPSTEPRADGSGMSVHYPKAFTEGEDLDDGLEVDLISDSNKIILNNLIPNGKKYIAQVCWNKPGALYSLPLSFAIPPVPPSSASLKIEYQAPKVTVEWDASPKSGADSWIVVLRLKDRELLRKETDTPKVELLLDEELCNDYSVVAEVYAKSSVCGLASTNFASKVVRHEAPPPSFPSFRSSHGSSSTAKSSSSPLVQPRESLASSVEQTTSSTSTPRLNQYLPLVACSIASTSCQDIISRSNLSSTRESCPGLVDGFDGFDTDSDDDLGTPVHDEMPINVDLVTDCLQDKIVATPEPMDIDNSSYFPVKTTFIDHQKIAVNNHYRVQLKSCDGSVHEATIYVHSIRYPQDPQDEASNVAVLQLSQYINWSLVHPDTPDNGLLLLYSEAEFMGTIRDSEMFSASAIVKVHECVQVSCASNSDATGPTARNFICNWSLRRIRSCKPGTLESFVEVPEHLHALEPSLRKGTPPRIDTLHFIDLFCGAGGASCGFKDAGFTPRFGVEASYVAGEAFQKNCPTAISYNECFDAFLGRPWPKNLLQTTVISVCAPSSIFGVDKHPIIQVINTFKPAYALYNCSVNQLSPNNISGFRKLQYQILKLGYGFTYGILKATDFGVSTVRNRLVLIAAAPSQPLPELPSPTHGGTNQPSMPTLQNAISDLDWKNTTCKATGTGLKSAVAHPSDGFHSVSRHCTGCIITDFTKWDDSCTVADLNEPLPGKFFFLCVGSLVA
ncbi:hypothetical protein IW261DRAFT_1569340 [Armillaria novae-zelandiae]|uniref:DNA (cytosine-5-)-methyltransferase n=1 Tax=Armillaria novae-zelandiae TaxID=153914 RepID=A0AA39UCU5_9AGAR|nr:hypothetical protein IW261DRAFT_1569340 [Armillaria novae-zelandiae]